MELVLSIYAAVLATIVGIAQLWSKRTRLKLRVNRGRATVSGKSDGGGGWLEEEGEVVFMKITNKSDHLVKVWAVGGHTLRQLLRLRRLIGRPAEGLMITRPYPLHLSVPIEIDPRDSVTVWFARTDLDGDLRTVFSAYTTGDRVAQTRPIRLSRRREVTLVTLGRP
jgi:hypothetical protein